MKLQLTPQSLRLRLDEAELPALASTGQLTQTFDLGAGQRLSYQLRRARQGAETLTASLVGGVLAVEVPPALLRQLVAGEIVTLRGETAGTAGQPIRIIVEKDLGPSH